MFTKFFVFLLLWVALVVVVNSSNVDVDTNKSSEPTEYNEQNEQNKQNERTVQNEHNDQNEYNEHNESKESGRKCVSGANYFDGCNWCVCHQRGEISCTLKYCEVYNAKTGAFEAAKVLPPPEDFWENPQSSKSPLSVGSS